MGVVTVVQARTGSSRLPRKVLLPLRGATVLDAMLKRVKAAHLAGTVVVATTTLAEDDVIVSIAGRNGVSSYRGHATDLLDRHYQAAVQWNATHVVKIPSDCPLIDPAVIDDVLAVHLAGGGRFDYTSNLHPATHPDGNDVEAMRFEALEAAWHEATRPFEREHTTPFIWNRPGRFRIANVAWSAGRDCSMTHRLVLDYPVDYSVIREVYAALGRDVRFSVADVVAFLDGNPNLLARNSAHRGSSWYRDHLDELPGLSHSPAAESVLRP